MLGLVFEGCANRAAFGCGVAAELVGAGLDLGVVAGASSGSIVAAGLAAGLGAELPRWWRGVAGRSIVSWRQAWRNRSPFAMSTLVGDAVRAALGDGDLRRAPVEALCTVTRLSGFRTEVRSSRTEVDFVPAVLGSCFVPVLYGRVVRLDGRVVIDGGATDNLPIAAAVARGARTIIAVVPAADGTARPRVFGPRRHPTQLAPPGVRVVTVHPPAPLAIRPWTLDGAAIDAAVAAGRVAAVRALRQLERAPGQAPSS
ncbi:MAG: patatin-like phospholipase family protein [Kofleriaceae bacterium]